MSDEAAFLRAIQADPTDRTAKLVYADWLDERGEAAKAGHVRAMVDGRAAPAAVPAVWHEVFHGSQSVWDEVTMLALGRLQGFLTALKLCSDHASDVSYAFFARLEPRSGDVQETADRYYGPDCRPVRLEALANWEEDVTTVLRAHLMTELGAVRGGGTKLALETSRGRDAVVDAAFGAVTSVLTPNAAWRAHVTAKHWYACDWTDLVLEAADRVLFLHFSFDD